MATLQKFKFLATQCAVAAASPTRSPTTSPVIHLRRRKLSTLRTILSRGGGGCVGGRRLPLPPRREVGSTHSRADGKSPGKRKEIVISSHKLKDLFVSSSPPAFEERVQENMRERLLPPVVGSGELPRRPLTAMFRQRLLRRVWRPVLVAIPESD